MASQACSSFLSFVHSETKFFKEEHNTTIQIAVKRMRKSCSWSFQRLLFVFKEFD